MQIIFSKAAAEELGNSYTVLELETFDVDGKILETFCVVPGESVSIGELPDLKLYKDLHADFIQHLKNKDYQFCIDSIYVLKGKFGGELDSFYEIILERSKLALEIKIIS